MSILQIDKFSIVFGTCPCYPTKNSSQDVKNSEEKIIAEVGKLSDKMTTLLDIIAKKPTPPPAQFASEAAAALAGDEYTKILEEMRERLGYVEEVMESASAVYNMMEDSMDPLGLKSASMNSSQPTPNFGRSSRNNTPFTIPRSLKEESMQDLDLQ